MSTSNILVCKEGAVCQLGVELFVLVRDFWLDVVDVAQIVRRLGNCIPNLNCKISKDILSHKDLGGTLTEGH